MQKMSNVDILFEKHLIRHLIYEYTDVTTI